MGKVAFISILIAAIAVFLGERIVNLRKRALASREVEVNHLPNCVLLPHLNHGSEDITILENGLAFISSLSKRSDQFCVRFSTLDYRAGPMFDFYSERCEGDFISHETEGLRYPGMPVSDDVVGKIYILELNEAKTKPLELRMPRNFDLESFNPHGISVYTDSSDGTVYLFVVNHPQHKSQIELFKFVEEDYSLVHLKTIKHELLYSVNDIVAVGVDSFYATNDHYFSNELMKGTIEVLLLQPWTNVVYYSPEEVKIVSDGYYFANGINLSPDKKHVYVADIFEHNVHVLERKENNELTFVKSVAVGSLCDNIEVDPKTGDLWLGCHPNAWKLFLFDATNPPGSEVIKIQHIHSDAPVVKQVYADDGKVLMGSSVAAPYGNKLLIGTVFHKALMCDLE